MSIKDKFGPAKVITATNVFAHIPNLQSFIEGVNILLDDNGVFVNESHYLIDILGPGSFKIEFRIKKYPGGLIYSFRS